MGEPVGGGHSVVLYDRHTGFRWARHTVYPARNKTMRSQDIQKDTTTRNFQIGLLRIADAHEESIKG